MQDGLDSWDYCHTVSSNNITNVVDQIGISLLSLISHIIFFLTLNYWHVLSALDHKIYLNYFIEQIFVSFCYSARTREGVQLAFEELVEKVNVDLKILKTCNAM